MIPEPFLAKLRSRTWMIARMPKVADLKDPWLTMATAFLGLVVGSIPLNFIWNIQFSTAPVAYLVAVRVFGLKVGLAAGAVTMGMSYALGGDFYYLVLAHVAFTHWFGRDRSFVDTTLFYVLFVQAPLQSGLLYWANGADVETIPLAVSLGAIDELCCAAFADVISANLMVTRPGRPLAFRRQVSLGIYLGSLVHGFLACICILWLKIQTIQYNENLRNQATVIL